MEGSTILEGSRHGWKDEIIKGEVVGAAGHWAHVCDSEQNGTCVYLKVSNDAVNGLTSTSDSSHQATECTRNG